MKTHEPQFDDQIREALGREEAELFDRLGPPTFFQMVTDNFRSSTRWLNVFGVFYGTVLAVVGTICLVAFFRSTELVPLFRWGLGFFFCLSVLLASKIWFWLEMQRNAISREIKRLELEVARLSAKLRSQQSTDAPRRD